MGRVARAAMVALVVAVAVAVLPADKVVLLLLAKVMVATAVAVVAKAVAVARVAQAVSAAELRFLFTAYLIQVLEHLHQLPFQQVLLVTVEQEDKVVMVVMVVVPVQANLAALANVALPKMVAQVEMEPEVALAKPAQVVLVLPM